MHKNKKNACEDVKTKLIMRTPFSLQEMTNAANPFTPPNRSVEQASRATTLPGSRMIKEDIMTSIYLVGNVTRCLHRIGSERTTHRVLVAAVWDA
jgi:hypothetical protein